MPMVKIAIGGEHALSDSRTSVTLNLTDEELATIRKIDDQIFRLATGGSHEVLNPRIHTQVLP